VTAPQFEALLAVQDLDTTIDQLRHRREHLPERAELGAVAKEGVTLAGRISDAKARQADAAARQEAAEGELAESEQRIVDIEKRMYGGTVSASRELQAMSAEVESLKRRCSELEEHVLETMEEREPVDAEVDGLLADEAELRRRAATLQHDISAREAEIDAELAREEAERDGLVANVPAELLETYEKLRAHLDGVGAARIVNNSCSGCHLSLPATEIARLRHEPDDSLIFCEQCGRILVR
jgi:predicted  nucleic acid-binding Zn-ribbon protein